jgi:hypothetical protein
VNVSGSVAWVGCIIRVVIAHVVHQEPHTIDPGQPASLPAWVVRPAQSSQVQCNKPFSLSFSKEKCNAVEFLVECSRMYVQLEMILVFSFILFIYVKK